MLGSLISWGLGEQYGSTVSVPMSYLLLFLVFAITCKTVYTIYFHPLSSFKGPFWASATPFYLTYLFATKKSHLRSKELHDQYGPVVRLGPNLLSFADPELLPVVYHRKAEKTPFYSTGLAGETAPLLQIQEHESHAAKVKVLAPAYSMKNLKLLENQVDQRITMVVGRLRIRHAQSQKPVDLSEWTRWYVYDTIAQIIYGEPAGFVSEERDIDHLIESWHDMFRLGGLVATLPWLVHPLITSWPLKQWVMPHKGLSYGSGAIMQAHERFFKHRLERPHLAQPGNIFDALLQTHGTDGKLFTHSDAERECFLLTVASQDTTAAFISPLILFLATRPAALKILRTEIAEAETRGALSTPVCRYGECTEMPYFMACVRETLRVRPPTPIILPRYAPAEGMMLGGQWLPPGTEIGANPWVIHRDPSVFGEDVDVWRPERWLEDPERTKIMDKYDFTWGYGSRKCVGKNIALMDGTKFVLQIFREFDVEVINPKRPWWSENWGINIYSDQWVRLHERKIESH